MERRTGHHYNNVQISDQAHAVLGDVHNYNQSALSRFASPRDYSGHYAYSSLRVVSTFVPRPSLRDKLHEQLHRERTDADSPGPRIAVAWGLGGAGKTQLVLDYYLRHRREYNASFWIDAGQKQTIELGFIAISKLLFHIPASDEEIDAEDAVLAVKNWFNGRSGRWVFVFDGADDIDEPASEHPIDINHFIPDVPHVDVIIITRSGRAAEMVTEAVEVAEMEDEQARTLFMACAKLKSTSPNEAASIEIVKELGCLALAVSLSGTYVSQTARLKGNLSGYLEEYRQRRREILSQKPSRIVNQYGESVLTTWESTFSAIAQGGSTDASRLLTLLGFVNFSDIFIELLAPKAEHCPCEQARKDEQKFIWYDGVLKGAEAGTYVIEECFRVLLSYGLLQERSDQSYSMHKLVHAWAFDRLSTEDENFYMLRSLMLLRDTIQKGNRTPVARQRLVPHIMANFEAASKLQTYRSDHGLSLLFLGSNGEFLSDVGRLAEASSVQRLVRSRMRILHGEEHPDTISAMSSLAATLTNQGKLEEAVGIKKEVLDKRRRILGEEHPDTIWAINNLAPTLGNQGKLEEAARMQNEVLDKRRRILGEEHPDTISAMSNLAATLRDQGKLEEAAGMQNEVLDNRRRILGEEHPDTISAMNNLAAMLGNQGKLEEAAGIKKEVLDKRRRILGEEHPDTISAMNNLAAVLGNQGKLEEAAGMQNEVLNKRRRILGEEHPDTISAMNNLAAMLGNQGKLEEAAGMQNEVLNKRMRILGEEHPDTISAMSGLATTLSDQGKLEEAAGIQNEVLDKRRRILGEEHPDTVSAMSSLATTLSNQGKLEEAAEMQNEVLDKRMRILGEEHPDTISAMSCLAATLSNQGKLDEAAGMQNEVLDKRRRILGEEHPDTISAMSNLATTLGDQGKLEEAVPLSQSAYAHMVSLLGPHHPHSRIACASSTKLSLVAFVQQFYKAPVENEAELCWRTVSDFEHLFGSEHKSTVFLVKFIGDIRKGQGKLDEAERM